MNSLPAEYEKLIEILQVRFQNNMNRHKDLQWDQVARRLGQYTEKLWSLHEMEKTGGQPDVVLLDHKTGEYVFFDCSPESPLGRRSLCYDNEALASRKKNKPANSAVGMAAEMGIQLLTEGEYRELQKLGNYDQKTSNWIVTPPAIRKLGGAIFADFRYGSVFVYHNGAESYYAARGFRGLLRV